MRFGAMIRAYMHRAAILLPLEMHERAMRYALVRKLSLGQLIRDTLVKRIAR